jgi:hypothetical protein
MTQIFPNAKHERMANIELIELENLRPHEGVDSARLKKLKEEIKSDGILKLAIAVDKCGNIILDGHHRVAALRELGYEKIPVVFVDYGSSDIQVRSRRKSMQLTKEDVTKAGIGSEKMPPKTSKHMVKIGGAMKHISVIEKRVDMPLDELKKVHE